MEVETAVLQKKNTNETQKEEKYWQYHIRKRIYRHVPITLWIQRYNKMDGLADVIAGVTLGLTLIPQSIAYSALAGVSPQYGLYSAFMGCFVYVIFGSIKEVSIGPTSLMSLLTYEYTRNLTPDFVVVMCFLVGCVEFLMGFFRLGFLVDYISVPVTSGFQTATSLIIIVSQMKGILGVKFHSSGFMDNLCKLFIHANETKFSGDFALGISCIIFLIFMRKLKDIPISEDTTKKKVLKHTLWLLSTSRNFLIVVITSTIAFGFEYNGKEAPFALTKNVRSGLPPFQFPTPPTVDNHTYMWTELLIHPEFRNSIVVIPVIAVLANVAIAKAFTTEGTIDATQEMFALSFCNILGSFFQSMPTCGAFTRSAVANASGVRTPLAGLYSGILTVLALTFLTPYFHLIPRATLSAVLITAVVFLIDWEICKPLWTISKKELFVVVFTLITCLSFGVEFGLFVGVCVTVLNLVFKWARPEIDIETILIHNNSNTVEYNLVRPSMSVYFPAVDLVCNKVIKSAARPVVVDCHHFSNVDYTAAKALSTLIRTFKDRGQTLIFFHISPKLCRTLQHAGCESLVHANTDGELYSLLFGYDLADFSDKPFQVLRGIECIANSKDAVPLLKSPQRRMSALE
uniref:STAS domain-containing protein n=2 Tax=Clastoptera arizonana TaxID=38151 RepID=A0A1B6E3L6_9HEMI